ncbi:MAG TPA: HD domain-containing phosphohydrolase [Burkholderiaceae bacterium]
MRAAISSKALIGIEELRVGMFIHLDMSWMSHPFPLGSFKIANAAQIETIRGLGLQRVRWNPSQSDSSVEASGWGSGSDTLGDDAAPAAAAVAADDVDIEFGAIDPAEPATVEPVLSPEARARRQHIRALAAQHAAQQLCERQFTEAARDCRQLSELAPQKPKDAKAQAEQLARALVDKMLGDQDMCIRLLTEAAGDKAAAHAMNVTVISLLMGRSLGLGDAEMLDLGVGAMLHDIGKLELPDRVRHREDHFSGSELRLYEEHVAHSVSHARKMGLSAGATLVIAQHHEHADGTGFPLRLNTDRMTPASRIVALVNRYDNLCNPHLAAKALTPHESLSLMFAQGKTKFDTAILGAFIRMMGVYPAGSAVQLTDDRFGLVVGVNSSRPLKPRVLVHEPGVPRDEALVVDLEAVAGLGIRRSIKPLQLPPATLEYLAPRPRVAYFFEALAHDAVREDALAAA